MLRASVLIILIGSSVGYSQTANQTTKTSVTTSQTVSPIQTAIEDAREMLLKGNRVDATKRLVDILKNEKKDTFRYREVSKQLEALSETFLTEEGQAHYELGRSLTSSDIVTATHRFRDALTVEPENESLVASIARAELAQGHCEKVLSDTEGVFVRNPYSKKITVLRFQALACLQRAADFRTLLLTNVADLTQPPYALLMELSKAQLAFFEEKWEAALLSLEKAKMFDGQMPEVYYWMGQVFEKTKKEETLVYRKYVDLCQEAQEKRKKFFDTEPRTCSELKRIEKQIEAKSVKSLKGPK